MEEFVKANNVGAESWRRRGILKFDGNIKNTHKVNYEKYVNILSKFMEAFQLWYCGTAVEPAI